MASKTPAGNVFHYPGCRCAACDLIRQLDVQRTVDAAKAARR